MKIQKWTRRMVGVVAITMASAAAWLLLPVGASADCKVENMEKACSGKSVGEVGAPQGMKCRDIDEDGEQDIMLKKMACDRASQDVARAKATLTCPKKNNCICVRGTYTDQVTSRRNVNNPLEVGDKHCVYTCEIEYRNGVCEEVL